jgi:hypothetical protein
MALRFLSAMARSLVTGGTAAQEPRLPPGRLLCDGAETYVGGARGGELDTVVLTARVQVCQGDGRGAEGAQQPDRLQPADHARACAR